MLNPKNIPHLITHSCSSQVKSKKPFKNRKKLHVDNVQTKKIALSAVANNAKIFYVYNMNHQVKNITNHNLSSRLSQAKSKKPFKNRVKQPLSLKSLSKPLKKRETRSRAAFYTDLSKCQKNILSIIISLNYKYKESIPSQFWIAKELGCTIRTVNGALAKFHELGIIDKKNRGWKLVSPKSNLFKSKTCEYKCGKKLLADMKFIGKNSKKTDKHIVKLLDLIPALRHILWGFFLLTVLNLNIGYLNSNIKYIQRRNIVVYGQDNYETIKESRNLKKLPTFTLSVGKELNSVLPEVHPGNICYNKYNYTRYNIECIKKFYISAIKREGLDLRYCTEKDYKKLSYEDRIIASRYYSGRKIYGSVSAYEDFLRKKGLYNKLWRRGNNTYTLSQDQKIEKELAQVNKEYKKIQEEKPLSGKDKVEKLSSIKDSGLRSLLESYASKCGL